jgi:hypothetical protein
VTALKRDDLLKARNVLQQLKKVNVELDELRKLSLQADYKEVERVNGEIE